LVASTVPVDDLVFTAGEDRIRQFESSGFGRRRFCGDCGTLLTMQVDHQAGTVDFTVATLDQPDAATPGFHIFYASRIGWADACDELPRYDRFRPDTRGLEGTEPPA
jgi:hypothetical protein